MRSVFAAQLFNALNASRLASYEIVPLEHVYDLKCLDVAIEDTNISTKLPTVDYETHKVFHMHEHGSYTQHVGAQAGAAWQRR